MSGNIGQVNNLDRLLNVSTYTDVSINMGNIVESFSNY